MSRAQRKIDIPNPSVFFPKKLFPIDHVQQLKRPFLVIESSLCTDNKKKQQQQKKKTKTKNEKNYICVLAKQKKIRSIQSIQRNLFSEVISQVTGCLLSSLRVKRIRSR